jgi:hypothetical protein
MINLISKVIWLLIYGIAFTLYLAALILLKIFQNSEE